jgi:hypothetical protein
MLSFTVCACLLYKCSYYEILLKRKNKHSSFIGSFSGFYTTLILIAMKKQMMFVLTSIVGMNMALSQPIVKIWHSEDSLAILTHVSSTRSFFIGEQRPKCRAAWQRPFSDGGGPCGSRRQV